MVFSILGGGTENVHSGSVREQFHVSRKWSSNWFWGPLKVSEAIKEHLNLQFK